MRSDGYGASIASASRRGFTLIEIVAVLVILGILGAFAVQKLPRTNAALYTEKDRMASHLRYTQLRAIADIYPWELRFTSSNTYQVGPILPEGFTPIIVPSVSTHSRALTTGVAASGTPIVRFDPWGRPADPATNEPFAANRTLTLQKGDATATIEIYAQTGYIP